MPISRRDLNVGDYVIYRHQNSGRAIVTRMGPNRSEVEVGEYLGYRSLDDAAKAARRDARERHAQNYQIYWENIGGLHVFTRNARRTNLSPSEVVRELDRISRDNPDIPNLRGSLARVPESRFYRAPPAGSYGSGGDVPDDEELVAWLFKARHEAQRRGDPRFAGYPEGYRSSGAELYGRTPKRLPEIIPAGSSRPVNRNPGRPPAPRPPRPGRRVVRVREPAAIIPRLRRMIDEQERGDFDPARSYPRETKPHHFSVNPEEYDDDVIRDLAKEGAARAFFVSAWADGAEEAGHDFGAGTNLDDVAPATPDEILDGAAQFLDSIEKLNGASISELFREAAEAVGHHERNPEPEEFGYYLAMAAMGHGVSWYDNHPEPTAGELSLPDVEVHVEVSEDDEDDFSIAWWELSERLAEPRH